MRHFIIGQVSCLAKARDMKLGRFLIQDHFKFQTPCSHTIHCSARFKSEVTDNERLIESTSIHDHGNSDRSTNTCMVTTPIFYVNAAPHVGHLFCALLADATARWQRIKGRTTLFTTGTDEHGLKIQQAAIKNGVNPKAYCDQVSSDFKNMFDSANIQYDRFIRTTDNNHKIAVHAFWNKLYSEGHIYKGSYAGWYSVSDEAFLTEDDVEEKVMPDGTKVMASKESGHPVVWTEEDNYKFRISNFKTELKQWLEETEIEPPEYKPLVSKFIEKLPDLSVSRDSKRLAWGIPVPGDDSQAIYVWLDALVNYLTAAGYPHSHPSPWPPNTQVLGKDILKFHAIYWPAFLLAAGMAPPPRLVVHSHWLVDGVKMSKSLGNVIDPMQKIKMFGVDGFRYFLLKEGSLSNDGTYNDDRAVMRINTDLANTLGNLLSRCTAPLVNKPQDIPGLCQEDMDRFFSQEERDMFGSLYELPGEVDTLYESFRFTKALDLVFKHLYWANALVQAREIWALAKSEDADKQAELRLVLHVVMETLRVCGILMQPVTPSLCDKLLTRIAVPESARMLQDAKLARSGPSIPLVGQKLVLIQRLKAAP